MGLQIKQDEIDAAFDAKASLDEVMAELEEETAERLTLDREGYPVAEIDYVEIEVPAGALLPVAVSGHTVWGSHCGCDFEASCDWSLWRVERKDGRMTALYRLNVNV